MLLLRKRLTQNTLALLTSSIGSAVLAFFLSVIIGRVLGEEGLGVYAASLAVIFPLTLISEFGLGTLITRDVAAQPAQAHAYIHTTLRSRWIMGGTLAVCTIMAAPILSRHPDVVAGIRISSPLIIILPIYGTYTAAFRARQQMHPIAALNLSMLIAQVSLTALLLSQGGGIFGVLWINTLTSGGQVIAAWLVYRRWFYTPPTHTMQLRPLLRAAVPFAIAAVLAAIQSRLHIVLLERFDGIAAVGFYAAAWRFIEAGRLIPHAFFDAIFPLLAGLATQPARLHTTFRRVLWGLSAFALCFALCAAIFAPAIIPMSYGTGFAPSIAVLQIGGLALLPLLLKSGQTLYWYARGEEQFVNQVTVLVIAAQLLVGSVLIARYGAVGAAISAILAEALGFFLLRFGKRA